MRTTSLVLILVFAACGGEVAPADEDAEDVMLAGSLDEDDTVVQSEGERTPFTTGPQIVFVDFSGPRISSCANYCSNAPTNRSWVIGAVFKTSAVDFAPYPSSSGRSAILGFLRRAYAGDNVSFVTTRPAAGPYSMIVISSSKGPHHGVAPLDCHNGNRNDIAFVYSISDNSVGFIERAAAHELAHTFGLAHVTGSSDIMHWDSSGAAFTRSTYDASHPSGKCFPGSVQDGPALLRAALGAR
jgi:hypothetical protein